jgi:hypothetical protein
MKNLIIQINKIQIARFCILLQLLLIGNFIQGHNKKEQIVLLQNKIDSLVSSHNKESTEYQNQIIELHAEIGKLKNEISAFQFKINTSKSTLENYQVQLKQKTDSLKNIQIQFDSITKNVFSLNKNFNYEDSTLLSFGCDCPSKFEYESYASEDAVTLGWSNEGCFYFLISHSNGAIGSNHRNPKFYCFCEKDKFPKSIMSESDSAKWAELEFDPAKINQLARNVISNKNLLSNNQIGIIADTHFENSQKFQEITELKEKNGSKKYYLIKKNGNKQLIKQYNPVYEEIDDMPFIYGDGEYTGYIKSPWNDTYILIFSYIDYYTGFERENECKLDLIFLK